MDNINKWLRFFWFQITNIVSVVVFLLKTFQTQSLPPISVILGQVEGYM